jgi:hypothetical protein
LSFYVRDKYKKGRILGKNTELVVTSLCFSFALEGKVRTNTVNCYVVQGKYMHAINTQQFQSQTWNMRCPLEAIRLIKNSHRLCLPLLGLGADAD